MGFPLAIHVWRRAPCVSLMALLFLAAGCGPTLYTINMLSAERAVDRAREENARWYAPYEFHFAEAHLTKAREEAAEASFEDAIRFAKTAETYSLKAIEIAERQRAEKLAR